jgi:hypothetical protein
VTVNAANPPHIEVTAATSPITAKAVANLRKRIILVQRGSGTIWVSPSIAACLDHMMFLVITEVPENKRRTAD